MMPELDCIVSKKWSFFLEATFDAKVSTWWKLWIGKGQISDKNTLWQYVCLTALCLGILACRIVLQIAAHTIFFWMWETQESWMLTDSLVSVQSALSSTFRRFRLISVRCSANIAWPEFAWTGSSLNFLLRIGGFLIWLLITKFCSTEPKQENRVEPERFQKTTRIQFFRKQS